jgi:hypothetical protein
MWISPMASQIQAGDPKRLPRLPGDHPARLSSQRVEACLLGFSLARAFPMEVHQPMEGT